MFYMLPCQTCRSMAKPVRYRIIFATQGEAQPRPVHQTIQTIIIKICKLNVKGNNMLFVIGAALLFTM